MTDIGEEAPAAGGLLEPPQQVAGAQTLFRALDVLDCFVTVGPVLSLNEISQRVGLTVPTTHRLIRALMARDMIVGDTDRRYSLGPAVMRLASVITNRTEDLAAIASPSLIRLRDETGETTSLHCPVGRQRVCVVEFVSPEPIRMESHVGHTRPLYAGASGKAMLAWAPDLIPQLVGSLEAVAPGTITDPQVLEKELAAIRRRGYAESRSEVVDGAAAVAVPVFGATGRVIGAINVSAPAARWTRAKAKAGRAAVLREAAQMMRLLGSLGPSPDLLERVEDRTD